MREENKEERIEEKRDVKIEQLTDEEFDDLFKLTMEKKWEQVVVNYRKHPRAHRTKLTKSEETALHIAISTYQSKSPSDHEKNVKEMISLIEKHGSLIAVLSMQNVRGDTPLHLAAAVGWTAMCQCIASKNQKLISIRNTKGETPLFIAAHHGNLQAFLCLHERYKGYKKVQQPEPDESLHRMKDQDAEPDEPLCRKKKEATSELEVEIEVEQAEPDESLCGKKKGATSDLVLKIAEDQQAEPLRRTKDGDTILHTTISGEHFRLAYQIIRYYPELINWVNVNGESPLHVLARKTNVFKSSSYLRFPDSIIYNCVFVDELKEQKYDSRDSQNRHPAKSNIKNNLPANYWTCVDILYLLQYLILIITGGFLNCIKKSDSSTDEENQHEQREKEPANEKRKSNNGGGFFPANYTTCILLFKFAMKIILTVLGGGFEKIKKIQVKKERYSHALVIMNIMIESESSYKYDSNGQRPHKNRKPKLSQAIDIPDTPPQVDEYDAHHNTETDIGPTSSTKAQRKNEEKNISVENRQDTPLLVAAKTGIPEMVKKIISNCPVAIQDQDSEGKNVLMLAAEHRQTSVFDYLMEINLPEYMFNQVDNEGNGIVHLAAMLAETLPWRIRRTALQMQWEFQWYKHVKRSVPPLCYAHHNAKGETPRKIFTRTHNDLMVASNRWLTKISESCSVVAALIAAVAFATFATVPGGLNQETGRPILKDHKAFDVFSISSLVALCLSVTALVLFLAIIASRFEERDFKTYLPRKLLMGLSYLFASIGAMLLSFCAGHTFILREKLRIAAVSIYAFATIPLGFFAISQLPLYFDVLYFVCTKVPLRSYKVFYQ